MPTKGRWTLNPRKWFGSITHSSQKKGPKVEINYNATQLPSKPVPKDVSATTTVLRIQAANSKKKVTPDPTIKDNRHTNSTNTMAYLTQLHLPTCNARRENTSLFLSSTTLFNRSNFLSVSRTEPSIRKTVRRSDELSIDATQWQTHLIANTTSKILAASIPPTQNVNVDQETLAKAQSQMSLSNISDQCPVDYVKSSLNNFIDKSPCTIQTQSPVYVEDVDDHDESSSSGVYTDERPDFNERQRTASKDTLSTIEALSIESIVDSQSSINHDRFRPLIHHYRLPASTFDTNDSRQIQKQRQTPVNNRSHRARSAEGCLKDDQTNISRMTRTRQSSAAIVKKIEKRNLPNRSSPVAIERSGFVRVATDVYRLTNPKEEQHLYRRQRQRSVIECPNYDDSLPPATDEESYAALPRTSSTEQLENNIEHELKSVIDDYLRPIVNSINRNDCQVKRDRHRSKRSYTNLEHRNIKVDELTDKLLSSINYSVYTQYQRCY